MMRMEEASYLFKKILKNRRLVENSSVWQDQLRERTYKMSLIYREIWLTVAKVTWKEIVLNNLAMPRAQFILWLVLKGRIATKDRLKLILCAYYVEPTWRQTVHHLFFACGFTSAALGAVLRWIGLTLGCPYTFEQLGDQVKGRNSRCRFLKTLITELVYVLWRERNQRIFQGHSTSS
ncbi:hypothetical protein OROHE_012826 [Orobanche hederae]